MEEKVKRRAFQFLLARFVLLNLFIDEAKKCEGGLWPSDHRTLWVLLQARPTDVLGEDAFVKLVRALRDLSLDDLETEIKNQYSVLECILESAIHPTTGQLMRRPLYCFLDEMQKTVTDRMGEYWSEDKIKERPLLRPIWESIIKVLGTTEMLVILSGTAINEQLLQAVLKSSAFTFLQYKIIQDIGAFDDPDVQNKYIQGYLMVDQSTARHEFLKRAWGWCRGRYFG